MDYGNTKITQLCTKGPSLQSVRHYTEEEEEEEEDKRETVAVIPTSRWGVGGGWGGGGSEMSYLDDHQPRVDKKASPLTFRKNESRAANALHLIN